MSTVVGRASSPGFRKAALSRGAALARLRSSLRLCAQRQAWIISSQFPYRFKRAIDLALSTICLALVSPLLVPVLFVLYASGGRVLRTTKLGLYRRPFAMYRLPTDGRCGAFIRLTRLDHLPVLFNVLKGDLSFVGPRALTPEEAELKGNSAVRRHSDRPGLICLWWIRRRANIDFGGELDSDAEYVESFSLKSDIGILLRAIPALVYGDEQASTEHRVRILGIPIDNVDMDGGLDWIDDQIRATDSAKQVCFVNADCANVAAGDAAYREVLQNADAVFADGIGMKMAGRWLRTGIRQNVNGTDLFPRLCARMAESGQRLYLLGAKPGVTERVAEWVGEHHPDVNLCGHQHGYFSSDEEQRVLADIRDARPDVLLVAFGAPRQDLWIRENLRNTGSRVAIGVGGLFDFFSGNVARAPQWMREIGMEWFYRFMQEPGRMWKRYFLGNGVFLLRVLRERVVRSGHRSR
ncbi:MAG: WecB/TagA/CpsF family glycosyltransferase [Pirellulaceae bacterium]|jgi:N-acetylglucosaminyldiphosphoundecaprenol N-acetyl-beta-D-mannosaminyltransferase|nr:WecB/TagA/CpsF family glycosyltransferase [Pirellulaceae bacterium]MDP7019233.1 WecB/TagA/CpsF family glycosyltransferase [Pirellulaceae bacterium]